MKKIRLGLCCVFKEYPIRFHIKQARYLLKFDRKQQLEILSETIKTNCASLIDAVQYCKKWSIGCFRINSKLWPLKTHPDVGYALEDLKDHSDITQMLESVRSFCFSNDIRLTFHPDQFVLLSSPKTEVVKNSIAELLYHNELAELVGADVIIIHGGGSYGDKKGSLVKLQDAIVKLPDSLRKRLVLENDDRIYTPSDLLPICSDVNIPLVYDVHHHRCLADGLTEEEATERAITTWNREPLFHLSSPRDGWENSDPKPHADMINPDDFPKFWFDLPITVEIEAKAKELAIKQLQNDMKGFQEQ